MKTLITGGAGFIGSHCAKLFLENGHQVVIVDNLSAGKIGAIEVLKNLANNPEDVSFYKADLRNAEEVNEVFDKENNIDAVVHFAAFLSVSDSVSDPASYYLNNVVGTMNLLNAMKEHNVKNIIFSSTCATYKEQEYLPIDEKHPTQPLSPYGETKLTVERMIKWYSEAYNMNYVILRYFNVTGSSEDGSLGDTRSPSPHLIQAAVRGTLGLQDFKLTNAKVDTPDGTPIRDYIDVNDLVEAHYLAYKYLLDGGNSELFNLGTGSGYSVLEIINAVEKVLNVTIEKSQGERRQGELPELYANNDKAKKVLGWEPKRSLEESVTSLVNWYKNHPNGFGK